MRIIWYIVGVLSRLLVIPLMIISLITGLILVTIGGLLCYLFFPSVDTDSEEFNNICLSIFFWPIILFDKINDFIYDKETNPKNNQQEDEYMSENTGEIKR